MVCNLFFSFKNGKPLGFEGIEITTINKLFVIRIFCIADLVPFLGKSFDSSIDYYVNLYHIHTVLFKVLHSKPQRGPNGKSSNLVCVKPRVQSPTLGRQGRKSKF